MCRPVIERRADMAGDNHGAETQEEQQAPQDDGQQKATQEQPQVRVTHNFFRKLTTALRNTARAPSYDF